jgi:hypothetical protein
MFLSVCLRRHFWDHFASGLIAQFSSQRRHIACARRLCAPPLRVASARRLCASPLRVASAYRSCSLKKYDTLHGIMRSLYMRSLYMHASRVESAILGTRQANITHLNYILLGEAI